MTGAYLILLALAVVIAWSVLFFVLGWLYGVRAQVHQEQEKVRRMQAEFLLSPRRALACRPPSLREEGVERNGCI